MGSFDATARAEHGLPSKDDMASPLQSAPAPAAREGNAAAKPVGDDERRMHVRAYNYWCSLLKGREFPAIQDLESGALAEFGANSVILDFTGKLNDPATPFVGDAIKKEIGVETVNSISDVPGRTLLSRLTDHHFQIIATRAPVGFEAEFVNQRGHEICYRGILMPFSGDGDVIDFVYGVINWKDNGVSHAPQTPIKAVLPPIEADREDEQEILDRLLAEEREHEERDAKRKKAMLLTRAEDEPVAPEAGSADEEWALAALAEMGISMDDEEEAQPAAAAPEIEPAPTPVAEDAGLADRLCAARESAEICKAADGRSRAALYKALGMAYDFSVAAKRVPEDYEEILDDAGVKAQARAPMTPIVKLVFGVDYDKTRLTEFAAALSYAERSEIDFGGFEKFVEKADGGLKGLVKAERQARRPDKPDPVDQLEAGKAALRSRAPLSLSSLATNEEFALVLTRRNANGQHEAVELVADSALLERLIRKAAQ